MYSTATANSAEELVVKVKELMNAGWRPAGGLAVESHSYIEEGTTQYNRPKFHQALMQPVALVEISPT